MLSLPNVQVQRKRPEIARWQSEWTHLQRCKCAVTTPELSRDNYSVSSVIAVSLLRLSLLCLLILCVPDSSARSQGAITALAFSPDGKQVAVGTYQQVVLYDAANWQVAKSVTAQIEYEARALAFSPDGKTLAIGCGEPGRRGKVVFWDTNGTAPPRPMLARQGDTIEAIAYRHDGTGLLTAAKDRKATYYLNLPAETAYQMDDHNGRVQAVAFSPKESYLYLTGGMDRMVKVWDTKYRRAVVSFDQSEGGITGLVFLNSGNQFVGSSLDGRLYWWQVDYNPRRVTYRGSHYRTIGAHDGAIYALAISGNRKRLITAGVDKVVSIWDADSGGKQRDFKESLHPNYAVALSPDGKIAVAGGREGVIRVWDAEANKLLQTLTPPAVPVVTKPPIITATKPAATPKITPPTVTIPVAKKSK